MSYVLMMTADKPLPLCDRSAVRTTVSVVEGEEISISFPCGFSVSEHCYYRHCTDALCYPFKIHQYELDLYTDQADLNNLKEYLREHFEPGETVDFWHVCVSDIEGKSCPFRETATLDEFNLATMGKLKEISKYGDQCWLSVTI